MQQSVVFKQFVIYDAVGDIAWALVVTLSGYFIGSRIPGIEHYIEPVLLGVIALFLLPTIYHAYRDPKIRGAIKARFSRRKKSDD